MEPRALFVVALALLPGADDPATDAEKLQGTWAVVRLDAGGRRPPREEVDAMRVTFAGDVMTLRDGKRQESGTFRLDPSKTPRELDLVPKGQEEVARFIYELDGDALRLCWRLPGGARPVAYRAEDDASRLMVLKRAK